jgi:hypothetical protein
VRGFIISSHRENFVLSHSLSEPAFFPHTTSSASIPQSSRPSSRQSDSNDPSNFWSFPGPYARSSYPRTIAKSIIMTTMSPTSPPVSSQPNYGGNLRPHRDRAVSSMSQASTSSRRSKNSNKLDLTESTKDKKRLNTKADPSKAITEAQPGMSLMKTSLRPIC